MADKKFNGKLSEKYDDEFRERAVGETVAKVQNINVACIRFAEKHFLGT